MRSDRPAAECEDLVKVHRTAASTVHALRGISATFPSGAVTAVAGPSGSGKSSLLRLIAGQDRPTSGRLEVDGIRTERASSRALRRLRRDSVGYVFQRASDNFFPYLTVGAHLDLALRTSRPRGLGTDEVVDVLGIGHRVDHLPSELSGGEQARAAMAQVLLRGSTIVVADEPTAELDTESAQSVVWAVRQLAELGVTFVIASHDPVLIRRCDEALYLDHGVLRRKDRAPADGRPIENLRRVVEEDEEVDEDPPEAARPEQALEASSLTKRYHRGDEEVRAVTDATFSVTSGELVGLIGRSGSGKTTLLNIAAGWERADSGRISVAGVDPVGEVPTWSDVAVLPQRLGLIEELTIRENVEYPARLTGRLEEATWLVEALIDSLGLTELQTRYPKEASVGEQQRTALARALVLSPRLLLADEPTGHQNAEWAEAMFRTLREAAWKGTACLAASHDDALLHYVDRVLRMSDGILMEDAAAVS